MNIVKVAILTKDREYGIALRKALAANDSRILPYLLEERNSGKYDIILLDNNVEDLRAYFDINNEIIINLVEKYSSISE
ncbi:MAG: hypothetical protein ACRCUS_00120, partial [Anaerovoracaceae bacterium]